jgi:CheY-like chemotaxis protein
LGSHSSTDFRPMAAEWRASSSTGMGLKHHGTTDCLIRPFFTLYGPAASSAEARDRVTEAEAAASAARAVRRFMRQAEQAWRDCGSLKSGSKRENARGGETRLEYPSRGIARLRRRGEREGTPSERRVGLRCAARDIYTAGGTANRVVSDPRGQQGIIRIIKSSAFRPSSDSGSRETGVMRPISKTCTLLVVDDESGIREVMTLALEAGGHNCVAAADGREALEVFRAREEDIHGVITDLNMPEMDGISLVRHLRELRPELPIVVSSGCITEESRHALEDLGVTAMLAKPYTATQLLQCVEPLLDPAVCGAAA